MALENKNPDTQIPVQTYALADGDHPEFCSPRCPYLRWYMTNECQLFHSPLLRQPRTRLGFFGLLRAKGCLEAENGNPPPAKKGKKH